MKKGFTLTELLISIAILVLLSAIVIPQLNEGQVRSRDTKRITDINNLNVAIQRYYNANGRYPSTGGVLYAVSGDESCYTSENKTSFESSELRQLVEGNFISALPEDPKNVDDHCYLYRTNYGCGGALESGQSGYILLFRPENFDTFGGLKGGEHGVQDWHYNDSWLCVSP